MTPRQYYFPYFFLQADFNKELKSFGLSSHFIINNKTNLADTLTITKRPLFGLFSSKEKLLSIPFGATLMLDKNYLFYWETDHNFINITQVDLTTLNEIPELLNTKIEISDFKIGANQATAYINTELLIAYVRKDSITYNQEYFEKFVILFIEKNKITVVPFDWFNKTVGDYGYVWPATAKFDKEKMQLHGQGMRMSDFVVDVSFL